MKAPGFSSSVRAPPTNPHPSCQHLVTWPRVVKQGTPQSPATYMTAGGSSRKDQPTTATYCNKFIFQRSLSRPTSRLELNCSRKRALHLCCFAPNSLLNPAIEHCRQAEKLFNLGWDLPIRGPLGLPPSKGRGFLHVSSSLKSSRALGVPSLRWIELL